MQVRKTVVLMPLCTLFEGRLGKKRARRAGSGDKAGDDAGPGMEDSVFYQSI